MRKVISLALTAAILAVPAFSQRRTPVRKPAKTVVFAVLNDGKSIEPIGYIDKGELVTAVDAATASATLVSFAGSYYRPKSVYRLVFGGADAGSVTVVKNDTKSECTPHMAQVTVASTRAKIGGMVMGLATNAGVRKGNGFRRMPTPAERAEAETLVRAEFVREKLPAAVAKAIKYHNLTAIDVDGDGIAELVGSFWAEPSKTERALLFFIAEKGKAPKYSLGYSEYRVIKREEVMSGDISALDEGVYHELLLDSMEYDGDTTAEIFTYVQGFEGSSFYAYSKREGKWVRAYEGASYHCGF